MAGWSGGPLNPYDKDALGTDEKDRVTYERDGQRDKAGIGVPTHQKDIDWQAVAADGIEFALLRLGRWGCSEDGLFWGQAFERNLRVAECAPETDLLVVTGVAILSDTLPGLLALSKPGAEILVINPTASMLPDALFTQGDHAGRHPVMKPDERLKNGGTVLREKCF